MRKLRAAEWFTLLGSCLLLASVFSTWYLYADPAVLNLQRLDPSAFVQIDANSTLEMSGWDLHWLRYFVYFAAAAGVSLGLATVLSDTTGLAVITATFSFLLGLFAAAAVAVRWIDAPVADADVQAGLYAAFAGALIVAAGSLWSLRDERTPPGYLGAPVPELVVPDAASWPSAEASAGDSQS